MTWNGAKQFSENFLRLYPLSWVSWRSVFEALFSHFNMMDGCIMWAGERVQIYPPSYFFINLSSLQSKTLHSVCPTHFLSPKSWPVEPRQVCVLQVSDSMHCWSWNRPDVSTLVNNRVARQLWPTRSHTCVCILSVQGVLMLLRLCKWEGVDFNKQKFA